MTLRFGKRQVAWGVIAVLAVIHYDFWYWDDRTLVFGFMPIGLFYQALISVLAGIGWAMVVSWAWPSHVEEWASQGEAESESSA